MHQFDKDVIERLEVSSWVTAVYAIELDRSVMQYVSSVTVILEPGMYHPEAEYNKVLQRYCVQRTVRLSTLSHRNFHLVYELHARAILIDRQIEFLW